MEQNRKKIHHRTSTLSLHNHFFSQYILILKRHAHENSSRKVYVKSSTQDSNQQPFYKKLYMRIPVLVAVYFHATCLSKVTMDNGLTQITIRTLGWLKILSFKKIYSSNKYFLEISFRICFI